MPSDDLSSIQGLEDKHLRSLARQHVTDFRGLVHADRRVIYRAMTNMRPRPTLEQISHWQDDARSKLEKAVTDTSDWHTAASFVVVFSQRQVDGAWERRVEAERTEVEPEQNMQVWSGWAGEPICGWMLAQLAQAGARSRTASENGAADAPAPPAEEPPGVPDPASAGPASPGPASAGPASAGPASPGPASAWPALPWPALPWPGPGPYSAAYRYRRDHRRDRPSRHGDGRRAGRPPAHRACGASASYSHSQRRATADTVAGRHPHSAPGRTRLERPGSGGRASFRPSRVRPVPGPRGRPRDVLDCLGARRHGQAGLSPAAPGADPFRCGLSKAGAAPAVDHRLPARAARDPPVPAGRPSGRPAYVLRVADEEERAPRVGDHIHHSAHGLLPPTGASRTSPHSGLNPSHPAHRDTTTMEHRRCPGDNDGASSWSGAGPGGGGLGPGRRHFADEHHQGVGELVDGFVDGPVVRADAPQGCLRHGGVHTLQDRIDAGDDEVA